jgi:hypothetical protein
MPLLIKTEHEYMFSSVFRLVPANVFYLIVETAQRGLNRELMVEVRSSLPRGCGAATRLHLSRLHPFSSSRPCSGDHSEMAIVVCWWAACKVEHVRASGVDGFGGW